MKDKLAIILDGGGMTSSYSVGVILALVEKYELTNPDIVITGSGGAGTLSYYAAKQYDSIRNIWSNLLSTKKFINPLRFWRIIDIDYLIDEVFRKQDPLDAEIIYNSDIDYFIAVTNYKTGKMEYISNKDGVDIFELMRATKAMPIVYNNPVNINGKNYCDSYISISTKNHIQKAIKLGANKIIVVDNGNEENVLNKFIFNFWLSFRNNEFKKNYKNCLKSEGNMAIPSNIDILTLKPENKLKITTLNNDQALIKKTIQQGYDETCQNEELKTFLEKYC